MKVEHQDETRIDPEHLRALQLADGDLRRLIGDVPAVLLAVSEARSAAGSFAWTPGSCWCNPGKTQESEVDLGRAYAWELRMVRRLASIR